MRTLSRAARPYALSAAVRERASEASAGGRTGSKRTQLEKELEQEKKDNSEIWVSVDDVMDILLLAGSPANEASVTYALRTMRNLLPGVSSGRLSFQEVLTIYKLHLDRPDIAATSGASADSFVLGAGSGSADNLRSRAENRRRGPNAESRSDNEKEKHVPRDSDSSRRPSDISRSVAITSAPVLSDDAAEVYPAGRPKSSGWQLPFRSTARMISRAAILEEFRRLDITGEGRLNYLNLKSALELREVETDDLTVRRWLKETDRGSKGYVDYSDYESIYLESRISEGSLPGGQRYGTLEGTEGRSRFADRSDAKKNERRNLLKR